MSNRVIGRIVLTGGPSTGKTAVIERLAIKGYDIIKEAARPTIEFLREHEPEKLNNDFLQKLIETTQLQDFVRNQNGIFDRGLPDQIGYRYHYGLPVLPSLAAKCEKYKYDKVFFFPIWPEIYKKDEVRVEDLEEAQKISNMICLAYKISGYELIEVPKTNLNLRVNFIEKHLKQTTNEH